MGDTGYIGSQFYDDQKNFETYMAKRKQEENANDTLEKTVVIAMLGDIAEKKILDLGCGDARFGVELLKNDCAQYVGIDGSKNMIRLAENHLQEGNGNVILSSLEDWIYPSNYFDIVISRLVFHYIENIDELFQKIYKTLKPGGTLLFSVEHPVITSTLQTNGLRTSWIVDNYFQTGYRQQTWMGGPVQKYHHPIEDYFGTMKDTGFTIEDFKEARPDRQRFLHDETYERRMRIPLFLIMKGKK